MRAKRMYRYCEPNIIDGFIEVSVDCEMLDRIIEQVEGAISEAVYQSDYESAKKLIDDYEGLKELRKVFGEEDDRGID